MPSARHILACVAAAFAVSTQGASLEIDVASVAAGTASAPDLAIGKFIAGVPVLSYDKAYTGRTGSAGILSDGEAEESWIVVLKPGTPYEELHSMCVRTKGCTLEGSHPRLPFVAMRGTERDLEAAVGPMRDFARYIDLDMTMEVDPPGDLSQAEQQEVVEATPILWGLDRIGAYKRSNQGAGVHVYVADTGVRTDHVEFGGRAVAWLDMFDETLTGGRLCNESSNAACGEDVRGHGTHCAGTIAGENYGVAPQAMVYGVKVLSDQGSGEDSGIIYALGEVALRGARPCVVSMSLGGDYNEIYKDAVDVLVDEGVTVVVAAGNEYTDACTRSPASVPNAITVGSTAYGDMRSGFSNFGTCMDIWAPGSSILSAGPDSPTDSGNKSGTSMACPHVAGAAALLLAAMPSMTPADIRNRMRSDASVNYIADLSPADENLFLYVGSDGPQPEELPRDDPWPSDEFFTTCKDKGEDGPRGDFPVCKCRRGARWYENGTTCYDGNKYGCPVGEAMAALDASPAYKDISLGLSYFLWNCTTCRCLAAPPTPEISPINPAADAVVISIIAGFVASIAGCTIFNACHKEQLEPPVQDKGAELQNVP